MIGGLVGVGLDGLALIWSLGMSVDVFLNAFDGCFERHVLVREDQGLGLGLRVCSFGSVLLGMGLDEPESLILAQSERWRHA